MPKAPRKSTRRKPRRIVTSDKDGYTRASDLKVIKADGTVETVPALSKTKYQAIVKNRLVTEADRKAVKRRDKGLCRYCGNSSGPWEIDHIVPVSRGGSNNRSNLVLACTRCNQKKVWRFGDRSQSATDVFETNTN